MLTEPALLGLAHEMVAQIAPDDDLERAAFVIRAGDSFELLHWPYQARKRTAQWLDPMPENVVAVIHTHPRRIPLPSAQDVKSARTLGLPFYVVSRGSLAVADASGRVLRAKAVPWTWPRREVTEVRWETLPNG